MCPNASRMHFRMKGRVSLVLALSLVQALALFLVLGQFFASDEDSSSDIQQNWRIREQIRNAFRNDSHIPEVSELAGKTVLRDFSLRVLSRSIAQSAVVVIGNKTLLSKSAVVDVANAQGHSVFFAPETARGSMEEWWSALGPSRPGWVLLWFVDNAGREAETLSSASVFLSTTTVTYIVVRHVATQLGTKSIKILLSHHYRVQVLSCTHAIPGFGPNTMLTGTNADKFTALASALGAETYLYATQGLDLAIPSAREYLQVSELWGCKKVVETGGNCEGSVPVKVPFKTCPKQESDAASLRWSDGSDALEFECRGRVVRQHTQAWDEAVR
eukprot:835022-Rhodomonas_salina.2